MSDCSLNSVSKQLPKNYTVTCTIVIARTLYAVPGVGKLGRCKLGLGKLNLGKLGRGKLGRDL